MNPFAAVPLFFGTAAAELGGCYLVFLWMRGARSPMLLFGAALLLATFAWLLSLHPNAGRAYAAYGGVYIVSAVAWGRFVDGHVPDRWDLLGAAVCFLGTLIIVFGPRP